MTRLGDLLIQQKLLDQTTLEQALQMQAGGRRRLGHILVKMNVITEDQLVETLSEQLDQEICSIETSHSADVGGIIPRYPCKQYSVLPLSFEKNNSLKIAMTDPSDDEAIRNLEDFTGMAISAVLARKSDIEREIPQRVPFSLKEFFSPQGNTMLTRLGVAACLLLIVAIGGFTYNYIQNVKYGDITVTNGTTTYSNLDLKLGFDDKGKISISGRGAFTQGFYSVSFTNQAILKAFLTSRKDDFSEKQRNWLSWVLSQEHIEISNEMLAASK